MKFHVLTLFPEMIMQGLAPSIIGRAAEKEVISLNAVNIRDYTQDKHGKVDDYPYGGGAGMLIQAQPVYDAYRAVAGNKKVRTVYVTPTGQPFTQKLAKEFAKEEELVFLCGHYEGIDERVLEEVVTDYVSIGDYVLTGGELPAMVMIDAIARLVPGVLGNDSSAEEESFHNDLLEYPQYSRPEIWQGKRVPAVLLTGNHKKIREWRTARSEERTEIRRPDLYKKYQEKQRLIKRLSKDKRNHIHMIESLKRGLGEILYQENGEVVIYDADARICMLLYQSQKNEARGVQDSVMKNSCIGEESNGNRLLQLIKQIPVEAEYVFGFREQLGDMEEQGWKSFGEFFQYLYPQKEPLPVRHKNIRQLSRETLSSEQLAFVQSHYTYDDITERISAGAMYGAFDGERMIGFMGLHGEGSLGLLYVDEEYRRHGIGESLQAYIINRVLEKGWIPFTQVSVDNEASWKLQEKLGLYKAGKILSIWER